MDPHKKKTPRELRLFGLALGTALTVIGGLSLWRGRAAGPWVLGVAMAVILSGLVAPQLLRPLERVLATVLRAVLAVVTYVVLTVAFYAIMTPMGLLVRLLGKDLLAMRCPSDEPSYWVPVEVDGPATRPDKPY
jgi:hypothetical protein